MKVFLTKDVEGVGKAQEVIDVADGYARNYLLPRGMAVRATEGRIKTAKQIAESQQRHAERTREQAEAIAETLAEKEITFTAKAGETGRLYGSITSADLAERLEGELGQEFDRRWILMDRPIRDVGEHIVDLKLEEGVRGHVKVVVETDEA
ncbi:MAG: 50S ribosomal protein L9 [Anaerolineae bacterium]